jgi:hypothetical protein
LKVGKQFATDIRATEIYVATKAVSNFATAFTETQKRVA